MNEEVKHVIGAVDIGGTKIAVGIVDEDGRVLARVECPTDADLGYFHALASITEMLRTTARMANTTISGIGIGSTGPVYPLTGKIGNVNFFPKWEGENPVKDLTEIFAVKVAIEFSTAGDLLNSAVYLLTRSSHGFRST